MSSEWDTPAPILLNVWKHHAGFLRHSISAAVRTGPAAFVPLSRALIVVGTDLMDLYDGPLTPARIAIEVSVQLRGCDRLSPDRFHQWIAEASGYRVLSLVDGSQWVLRAGESGGRFVHLHPARWGPNTVRVRANTLKTAVLALAFAGSHQASPLDAAVVNRVRQEFLDLPPMKAPFAEGQGLAHVLGLLLERLPGI